MVVAGVHGDIFAVGADHDAGGVVIVFALKILCGFSTQEIALRLFSSHEAIYKRLQRACAALREHIQELESPAIEELASRLPAVLEILYLIFTKGYSSAQPDEMIRPEVCEEAIRLGLLLDEHPVGAAPQAPRSQRSSASAGDFLAFARVLHRFVLTVASATSF